MKKLTLLILTIAFLFSSCIIIYDDYPEWRVRPYPSHLYPHYFTSHSHSYWLNYPWLYNYLYWHSRHGMYWRQGRYYQPSRQGRATVSKGSLKDKNKSGSKAVSKGKVSKDSQKGKTGTQKGSKGEKSGKVRKK